VVATCYLLGVSTRRMDKLVQSLGITTLSKSQVSEMAKDLDAHVEQFRTRRLDDAGPFTFLAADAQLARALHITQHVWPGGHNSSYWNAHIAVYLRFYESACRMRPTRSAAM